MGIADFYEDSAASLDDLAQIRQAIAESRANRAEQAKSDAMAELVALRDTVLGSDESVKVTKSGQARKARAKGEKSAKNAEFPHTLTDAEGRNVRYKVVKEGHIVLKPQKVHDFSLKRDNYMEDAQDDTIPPGMGEWCNDPEFLVCSFLDIDAKLDYSEFVYETYLGDE